MTIDILDFQDMSLLIDLGLKPVDIYQTAEYVKLDAKIQGGKPSILIYTNNEFKAAIPFCVREIDNSTGVKYYDAVSPYGYPGIIFSTEPDTNQIEFLFTSLKNYFYQSQFVSAFIRLHPLSNQFTTDLPFVQQIQHGKTVYISLDESPEKIKRKYSTNHKRNIKKLLAEGFNVHINNENHYDPFQIAYRQTMVHVGASEFYFFDEEYFKILKTNLGENLVLISVTNSVGNFAAGALFTAFGEIVEYHLGGTSEEFRASAPSKLIFDSAISYFETRGFKYLHLGGGLGSLEDELFRFKMGFSKSTWNFSTIRMITNDEIYRQLSEAHLKSSSRQASNYFPLYRQP